MRDWNSEARRNSDVLTRILALLVALAALADLASSLSVPRRRLLLKILMWGEAEAFAFVTGMAADAPPLGVLALADEPEPAWNDTPEPACDPARLAASLRALALALWFMLAAMRRLALSDAAGVQAGRRQPAGPARPRLVALPAPDTS